MTKEDSVVKIKSILKELSMSGAKDALEDTLKQSKAEALSYEGFLQFYWKLKIQPKK